MDCCCPGSRVCDTLLWLPPRDPPTLEQAWASGHPHAAPGLSLGRLSAACLEAAFRVPSETFMPREALLRCTRQATRRHLGHHASSGTDGHARIPLCSGWGRSVLLPCGAGRLGCAQKVAPILLMRTLGLGLNCLAQGNGKVRPS